MAQFSRGIPRWIVLLLALVAFVALPPDVLALGPDICLWRHLFGLRACPACGTTRALAAFFHGHLSQALAYNRNVMVTGPMLIALLAEDLFMGAKLAWGKSISPRSRSRIVAH